MIKNNQRGFFSMVGLIVVILLIGLLFVLAFNYYRKSGAEKTVDQVTKDAINASLQTDLKAASLQLKVFLAQNNSYPVANDCSQEPAVDTVCLKVSNLNKYIYTVDNASNPPTFSLVAQNANGSSYKITDNGVLVKLSQAE